MLLCILPGVGLGISGATLVGQALGRGDLVDARAWGQDVIKVGMVLMGGIGLILAVAARTWLGIFLDQDPATVALAVPSLVLLGLGQAFDSVGVVLTQTLIGIGDTFAILRISLIGQWLLFLPAAWWLCVVREGGLMSLWVAMVIWRLGTAAACALRWRSGVWARSAA